jgi:hypothetical protein
MYMHCIVVEQGGQEMPLWGSWRPGSLMQFLASNLVSRCTIGNIQVSPTILQCAHIHVIIQAYLGYCVTPSHYGLLEKWRRLTERRTTQGEPGLLLARILRIKCESVLRGCRQITADYGDQHASIAVRFEDRSQTKINQELLLSTGKKNPPYFSWDYSHFGCYHFAFFYMKISCYGFLKRKHWPADRDVTGKHCDVTVYYINYLSIDIGMVAR